MEMIVTEKDWESTPEKQRSWILFNTIQDMNARLAKLESRSRYIDKTYSFIGGIIGGILSWAGLKATQ